MNLHRDRDPFRRVFGLLTYNVAELIKNIFKNVS